MPLVSEVSSAAQPDQSMTSAKTDVKSADKSSCIEMLKREVCNTVTRLTPLATFYIIAKTLYILIVYLIIE